MIPISSSSQIRIVEPSPFLLHAVQEELARSLPDEQKPLLKLLGISDFLTCITVVRRERAIGRMILSHEKLEAAGTLVGKLGLHWKRSGCDYMLKDNIVEGTDHEGAFVPRCSPGANHGVLYFGLCEELVAAAEDLELIGEHRFLGQLFGYPECCVRFLVESRIQRFDKTPEAISDAGPFPSEMNPLLPALYGLHLLFHFPCSPRCEASREILWRRQRYLAHLAPSMSVMARWGAGIALYGPQIGMALVTAYRTIGEGTYMAEEITTRSEQSRRLFLNGMASIHIRIKSCQSFAVGDTVFKHGLCRVAIFV